MTNLVLRWRSALARASAAGEHDHTAERQQHESDREHVGETVGSRDGQLRGRWTGQDRLLGRSGVHRRLTLGVRLDHGTDLGREIADGAGNHRDAAQVGRHELGPQADDVGIDLRLRRGLVRRDVGTENLCVVERRRIGRRSEITTGLSTNPPVFCATSL